MVRRSQLLQPLRSTMGDTDGTRSARPCNSSGRPHVALHHQLQEALRYRAEHPVITCRGCPLLGRARLPFSAIAACTLAVLLTPTSSIAQQDERSVRAAFVYN